MTRQAAEAGLLGASQRLLLRAGPADRRVPAGKTVRHADLGQGARRQRTADPQSGYGSERTGNLRVARRAGCDELVLAILQSSDESVLSHGLGKQKHLSQG